MRYVKIEDLKPGDITAENISFNSNLKTHQINAMIELTEKYIEVLKANELKGIYIYEEATKDIIVDDMVSKSIKEQARKSLIDLRNAYVEYGKSKKNNDPLKSIIDKKNILESKIDQVYSAAKKIGEEIYMSNGATFNIFDFQGKKETEIEKMIAITELTVIVKKNEAVTLSECENIAIAALFSDIGKFAKDSDVLSGVNFNNTIANTLGKNDFRTYQEKYHSLYSYCMVMDSSKNFMSQTKTSILNHNEYDNGEGALGRELTPIDAKIIGMASTYIDIITGSKGIEYAIPKEARAKLMQYVSEGKYDTDSTKIFLSKIAPYPKGTNVSISNRLKGTILENNSGDGIERPIILLSKPEDEYQQTIYDEYLYKEQLSILGKIFSSLNVKKYEKNYSDDDKKLISNFLNSGNEYFVRPLIETCVTIINNSKGTNFPFGLVGVTNYFFQNIVTLTSEEDIAKLPIDEQIKVKESNEKKSEVIEFLKKYESRVKEITSVKDFQSELIKDLPVNVNKLFSDISKDALTYYINVSCNQKSKLDLMEAPIRPIIDLSDSSHYNITIDETELSELYYIPEKKNEEKLIEEPKVM